MQRHPFIFFTTSVVHVSSWSLTPCLEEMRCWFQAKPTCSVNTGSLRGWQWSNRLQSTRFGWQPAGWSPATLPHSLHHVAGFHWQAVSDDPPWGCVGNIKSYWLWGSLWTSEAQPLVLCSAGQRCSDNCPDGSCEEWLNESHSGPVSPSCAHQLIARAPWGQAHARLSCLDNMERYCPSLCSLETVLQLY